MDGGGSLARIASLFALISAVVIGGHAYGQQSANQTDQKAQTEVGDAKSQDLEEIVVTATATGVRQLDASFQITIAGLEEIHDVNPSSSADLLKIVPSIWVESGGGAAGPNIELAGYPSNGDRPEVGAPARARTSAAVTKIMAPGKGARNSVS